ncbi:MAG: hypothetical protein A3K65_06080 [Euryarchaeota archaeon RBG_16_68_12]|nr:MAG: hypothetical protein A3K65_06080 [Euryarchaeota archaeon RBG_16_68_12]
MREQSEELEVRESQILEKEKTVEERATEVRAKEEEVVAKVSELEAKERDVRQRVAWAEKDDRRRAVMELLDGVPGMTIRTAKAITNAFPDIDSLRGADVKALTQCEGVTEALAKEIRALVAPESVDAPPDLQEQARGMLEEGDTEGALRVIEQLLRDDPKDETAWFDKAELEIMLDRPNEALHCYNRVLDLNRGNRQAWYEKANLLFGAGRLADAVDCLREVMRLDPAKATEILLKAEQLRIDGNLNDAALLFQAVMDADPENTRAVLGLGDSLMGLGDEGAAEALVTRALGKDPANPAALYRKGVLLNRKGRWGAALQLFHRAIALKWDSVDPWVGKGDILLARDRSKEALEAYDKALSFDNRRVGAWLGKAQAHYALEEKDTAQSCLNRALQLDPHSPAVKEVADLFDRVREAVTEAPEGLPADFKAFIEAVEPEKEETETLLQLAEMALEGGDPDMAILRYDQALEKDPRSADAWTGKGIALQHQERYREALECYDRALVLHPAHDLAIKWRETCAKRIETSKGAPG